MYDNYISSDRFHAYRGDLSKIYQGEDVDYSIEEIENSIHKDYENGKLSSTQYDNLMSLVQDINKMLESLDFTASMRLS